MNVLNVAYNFNTGGVERLIIDVSNELAKQNVSAYLCIINNSYTQSLLDSIDDRVVIFHLKKIGKNYKLGYLKQLIHIIKQNKIDVVHIHQGNLIKFFSLVKLACPGTKYYYTLHDTRIFFELSSLDRFLIKVNCNKIIAISDAVRKDALAGGIPENKVQRIYNGVNFDRFKIAEHNSEQITICNVARFIPHKKGQDLLIEAVNILKTNGKNIRCYFAGAPISTEDSEYQQILSKIREYGLEENVFLLGNVSDVPSLLAKADVFVVPSRFEGFGIVAVEAAAAGIPCVASNIDGLAEVVNDKRLGCLFEVGNAEALAKAIVSVVINISEFNPNWIRENAYNRFSIQVMTSALLNVYKG